MHQVVSSLLAALLQPFTNVVVCLQQARLCPLINGAQRSVPCVMRQALAGSADTALLQCERLPPVGLLGGQWCMALIA